MTTREFDPVLSAALRNELEALADGADDSAPRAAGTRPVLRRPQVWITAATALLLVVATLGVLRLTAGPVAPAGGAALTDALYAANGPSAEPALRGAPVAVLLKQRARGTTTFDFTVPAGSTSLYTYVTCAPRSPVTLVTTDGGTTQSTCSATGAVAQELDSPQSGANSLEIDVPGDTRFSVFAVAVTPDSGTTMSFLTATPTPGHVTDPRSEILDPRSDAYIRHEEDALLDVEADDAGTWTVKIPEGVTSIRPYVNCADDTSYSFGIDGFGDAKAACASKYAGTLADIPIGTGEHTVTLRLAKETAFSLLVIATPVYAPSSPGPAKPPLPYPSVAQQDVLTRVRGDSRIVTGRLAGSSAGVRMVITCKGTGSVTVATDFGMLGSPVDRDNCGAKSAISSGGSLAGLESKQAPHYTITPYGDVSWTVTFTRYSD